MKFITETLMHYNEFKELSLAIDGRQTPCVATGLSAVHKAVVSFALSKKHGKKLLILTANEGEGNKFFEDIGAMGLRCAMYPTRDFNFLDGAGVSHEYERARLDTLKKISDNECDCVIACIDAALQLTMPKNELKRRELVLKSGDTIKIEELLKALVNCGYQRAEQTEGIGQFSHRGGIVDFFPPGESLPKRIEFWGDEIDTISYFDIETQRRGDSVESAEILPALEVLPKSNKILIKKIEELSKSLRGKSAPIAKEFLSAEISKLESGVHISSMDKFISLVYDEKATLFDYFDPETSLIVFSEGSALKERERTFSFSLNEEVKDLFSKGILCKGLDTFAMDWIYALSMAEKIPSVHMDVFARGSYEIPTKSLFNMTMRQLAVWGGSFELLKEDLQSALHKKQRCAVLSGTEKSAKTLAEDLQKAGFPAQYFDDVSTINKGTVAVLPKTLSAGLEVPGADFTLISHGRVSSGLSAKKKKKDKNSKEIYSLSELNAGDYVVHSTHGVGVFDGIHKIDLKGIQKDYIKIRYAKNDTLYVPVTQLDMVAKYIGPKEDSAVKIHRLGGAEWQKAKARVKSAVKDIAKELIVLYAKRLKAKGYAFPEDGEWQRDFEGHFEYDETEDQLRCINEIKNDMEAVTPMDRLLCGDVGFGKTEVALRAAFKCITAGKQCAILVPTTILAWQHFQTAIKRLESFPTRIELLSRFRTPKQQEKIIKDLKRGYVDMIIGTHRLVSKDVQFKDLGLVIIDEEQRFGVAQKEKLKALCKTADILTLSATPIPRTLNMALSGVRDMSVIEEAPHDRHPVQTYVMEYDLGIICDAIRKELRRGGQVYYLHNDVASIKGVAARIQAQIPEVRIGIGHGKMDEKELSEVWRQLMEHEIDMLICTTIIETGVDVPNANTLIIDNADRMGLSQLHQLRGRVGRSNRRAYAYLTYTQNKILTEIAQKRLSAIREFTEFGSGFKIALRDLEIRGAGNILGGEQHGHMESVGYDMYLKLLNEAVALMKGEEPPMPERECIVDMQVQAHIPESYVSATRQRLEIYRRIADIKDIEDSIDVVDELIDRFGEPPQAVKGLIDIALLRNRAAALNIKEVKQQATHVNLFLDKVDMEAISKLISCMKGRVLLKASTSPYISISLNNQDPLAVLEDALTYMSK